MSANSREQSAGAFRPKERLRHDGTWLDGSQTKLREQQRMLREPERTKHIARKFGPMLDQRFEEPSIGWSVAVQLSGCLTDIEFERYRAAVVQRMGQLGGRPNPIKAVVVERQSGEKR